MARSATIDARRDLQLRLPDSMQAWFARGTARVYVNPNFRLEGTVLYADGDIDFGPSRVRFCRDFETWLWRAKAEYKFATLAVLGLRAL